MRKLFPFSGSGGKPGDNPYADVFKYVMAWNDHNPNLAKAVYVCENKIPDIPMYPKAKVLAELRPDPTTNGKLS